MALPPGPSAPALVQAARWMRSPVKLMEDGRERFGETFTLRMARVGELVFISDPQSIKRLFSADRDNRLPRGRSFLLEPVLGPRSLLLPPFHGERMRAYEAVMAQITDRELDSWPLGRDFPLQPRMQSITLEVILRAVFGVEDPVRRKRLRELLIRLLEVTSSPRAQVIGLASRRLGRLGPYGRLVRLRDETDAALFEQIAERRADPEVERRDDILSLLVAARFDDGEPMSDREVRDQLMTLLLAGHQTTATARAGAFGLLFRTPEAFERLLAELAVGRDRFLDGAPDTYSWIPFGGGTRRCLGAAFASFEMKVVLRTILRRATLRPATDRPEPFGHRNVTLSPRHGTPAILEERRAAPEPAPAELDSEGIGV